MKRSRYTAWLILAVVACGMHCVQPKKSVDLILVNGQFFTADPLNPTVSAVAISADTILAVGTDAEIQKLVTADTKIIDLHGAFAMPGFIEGHGHFIGLGQSLQNLNLLNTKSWDEIVGLAALQVKQATPGAWIEGRGWHQEKWTTDPGPTVNGYPYHDALSSISPSNPIVLFHASGHGLMANTVAMQLAGISRETPDPIGGRIVRDAKGNPIGVFEENAMDLIVGPYTEWENRRSEAQKLLDLEKTVDLAAKTCIS